MVYRRARRLLKNDDLAGDCMHETFIKVMDSYERLDLERPSSLLYTIATNTALNMIKRDRTVASDEQILAIADHDEQFKLFELKSTIGKIFQRNDDTTNSMAILHYCDGWTLEQVADFYSMSSAAVRKRLKKMKHISQQEIEHEI